MYNLFIVLGWKKETKGQLGGKGEGGGGRSGALVLNAKLFGSQAPLI